MMTAHIIVLANEKGGSGKSTTAVHIAVALAAMGHDVAAVDLDSRQRTTARYMENRAEYARKRELTLPQVPVTVLEEGQEERLAEQMAAARDFLIVDTPGRDSAMARAAIARADTLVTPINDSFVDFDLIGQVDADSFKVKRPGFYSELVWKARQARAKAEGKAVDWVVLRNRLSTLEARNRKRVGAALDELSRRVGFRVVPGLSERVIYRELFPSGLTLLDMQAIDDKSMSHLAARGELRQLIEALSLPARVPA